MSKKYKFITDKRHKVIGYTYDGKPVGWIECGING